MESEVNGRCAKCGLEIITIYDFDKVMSLDDCDCFRTQVVSKKELDNFIKELKNERKTRNN